MQKARREGLTFRKLEASSQPLSHMGTGVGVLPKKLRIKPLIHVLVQLNNTEPHHNRNQIVDPKLYYSPLNGGYLFAHRIEGKGIGYLQDLGHKPRVLLNDLF